MYIYRWGALLPILFFLHYYSIKMYHVSTLVKPVIFQPLPVNVATASSDALVLVMLFAVNVPFTTELFAKLINVLSMSEVESPVLDKYTVFGYDCPE